MSCQMGTYKYLVHAKDQYLTLKKKHLDTIPVFGGFEKNPFLVGNVLYDIDEYKKISDDSKSPKLHTRVRDGLYNCILFNLAYAEIHTEAPEILAERKASWNRQRERFLMNTRFALFGGLTLIIPMLIMTLHQTLLTTLLTTALFVFAIAALLARYMDSAEPKDIVGATAAYAAVLVVFVGTGGGSSSRNKHTLSNGALAGIIVGALVGATVILAVLVGLQKWWHDLRMAPSRHKHGVSMPDQKGLKASLGMSLDRKFDIANLCCRCGSQVR
jgi:hypothetical protein